ncbi:inverse autotransporter beta domain-containing protein [Escherichia coli]|nr:inverse autotransporter beta domain-containing protein [Escherichia coli]
MARSANAGRGNWRSKAEHFALRDMDSEQAASMARGWGGFAASARATDWLSRWGTARYLLVWMIPALKARHLNFSIRSTKRPR